MVRCDHQRQLVAGQALNIQCGIGDVTFDEPQIHRSVMHHLRYFGGVARGQFERETGMGCSATNKVRIQRQSG